MKQQVTVDLLAVSALADTPRLQGDARSAVEYRGGHIQIIASAGAGKTEVVSQRVASLLADGFPPDSIVAFTFTERAAASLKGRIEQRVLAHPKLGHTTLDRIGGMFVGTIHAYCFRVLQQYVPRYETFDVLDDNRLTAFLTREARRIGLKELDGTLFKSIRTFLTNLEVIENELLEPHQLDDPLRGVYEQYLTVLEEHRFLTYGQQVARAVAELKRESVFATAHGPLRHLIVDEYQDVNPAQERLVERLAANPVHLCVVGDDDQSIYQWRGADVGNIVAFARRYPGVRSFKIETNRRSRPSIIRAANAFGETIEGRLPKTMLEYREASGSMEFVCWSADTPHAEAVEIARLIRRAHDELGHRFRDIAILCRGRVSLPPILEALEQEGVPVQPGGRTNLFLKPDAVLFGKTLCWLADTEWREGDYSPTFETVTLDALVAGYAAAFELSEVRRATVAARLREWHDEVAAESRPANLVRDFYDLLGDLGVAEWDLTEPLTANRVGTLARCSQLLADYEAARRRSRPDHENPGEQKGAQDRGQWYYRWLAIYVNNWARGAYEDFEGEDDFALDAVDLTTIHQAKGLEWPLVFVPALSDKRFPSSRTGTARDWRVATDLFSRVRYEGTVNDERRLFYVAMTRARDYLSLSTFARLAKSQKPSRFLVDVTSGAIPDLIELPLPAPAELTAREEESLEITFSELASFRNCGKAYRFRTLLGFQPPLVPELGYGKAVHHVLRQVAEHVRRHGATPSPKQLERLFDDGFYLPAANKAGHAEMKRRARELVQRYLDDWGDDLLGVWEVERPFELHLGGVTVVGRADVIVDESGGEERLTIVDYKTAANEGDQHGFQLQVYTDAGRREGLAVERAFVHDLRNAERIPVPVEVADVEQAEDLVLDLVGRLRTKVFDAKPERSRCRRCDVRPMCKEGLVG
jgi:DNA helicase-2/ATP-dependent DNA helicase PcrA